MDKSSAAGPSLRSVFSVSPCFSSAERLSAPRTRVCPFQLRHSWEETSIPARRQRCHRRSAVRSRGKWPRRTHSSPWRWSSRTEAPRQSSETVADREERTLFLQHWTSHHGNFCRADNLGRKTPCSDAFDINCAAFYIWTLSEHLNNLDSKGKMWKHSTSSERRGVTADKTRSALTVHEALRGSRAYVISWFFHMISNIVILYGWKFQIMLLFQSKVTHTPQWHS